MRKQKEMLSFTDKYRLCEWVKENKDRILAERPTRTDLAKEASGALKDPDIHVNENHLRGVLETLGMDLDSRLGASGSREMRMAKVRVEALERKVETLAKLLGVTFTSDGAKYTEGNGRQP